MTPAKAYGKVRTALKNGALVRPTACSRCGTVPPPASDGRATIQAHHHDYSKPLDVEWICAACHRKETPLPSTIGAPQPGEKNGNARLTNAQADEIRSSPLGYVRLARIWGVNRTTIRGIKKGQRYNAHT